MAEVYSQYVSGNQVWEGTITGSSDGVSGINPMVDRLNSITTADNLVTGSFISGLHTLIWPGSIFPNCFVAEQRGTAPTDGVERRLWIQV